MKKHASPNPALPRTRVRLKWRNVRAPLAERHLRGAEQLLGVRFPSDYRDCVRIKHGAVPDPACFVVPASPSFVSGVGVLLTLDPYEAENVFAVISQLAEDEQLPHRLIPIADDGGGDLVCLDYRRGAMRSNPAIVYWSHEQTGKDAVTPLAATFSEFLQMLKDE